MLIPQFSTRFMLLVVAVCSAAFFLFSLAMRGSQWATGISAVIVALCVLMLVYAAAFLLVWLFTLTRKRPSSPSTTSDSQQRERASASQSPS